MILLNAWLDSGEDVEDEICSSTLDFWAARLRPLWAKHELDISDSDSEDSGEHETGSQIESEAGEETLVVICNRCGEENGTQQLLIRIYCTDLYDSRDHVCGNVSNPKL